MALWLGRWNIVCIGLPLGTGQLIFLLIYLFVCLFVFCFCRATLPALFLFWTKWRTRRLALLTPLSKRKYERIYATLVI